MTKDPTNVLWQDKLGYSHYGMGSILKARNDLADAVQEYKAALAIGAQLAAKDPGNVDWHGLSVSHNRLGGILETRETSPAHSRNFAPRWRRERSW